MLDLSQVLVTQTKKTLEIIFVSVTHPKEAMDKLCLDNTSKQTPGYELCFAQHNQIKTRYQLYLGDKTTENYLLSLGGTIRGNPEYEGYLVTQPDKIIDIFTSW